MATLTATRMGYPARAQEKGVFCEVSSYTLAAAQIGDIVNLCKIPNGATVIGVELVNAALGGSTTVSIGDTANSATYYLNAQATNAAGRNASAALRKAYAADDTLKATIGGAAATGVIQLVVYMTMEATVLS